MLASIALPAPNSPLSTTDCTPATVAASAPCSRATPLSSFAPAAVSLWSWATAAAASRSTARRTPTSCGWAVTICSTRVEGAVEPVRPPAEAAVASSADWTAAVRTTVVRTTTASTHTATEAAIVAPKATQ